MPTEQITATAYPDGSGTVNLAGTQRSVATPSLDDARAALLALVAEEARRVGHPLAVTAEGPDGRWPLQVHPNGQAQPTGPAELSGAPSAPRPAPRSFLADSTTIAPPLTGWRAFLARFGFRGGPSAEEQARWADERAISQHWPGPKTIAVLNGKGGANKTPTTVLLSALFARAGGAGVLAWDSNVTRGTLGWRTESGPHDATVLDLLPRTDELLTPGARAADLAAVVHHQTQDKYDVLRSNPLLLSTAQKLTPDQLDAVHAVAAKYYRLIIMDSGNDEGDSLWLRMIDHTTQAVVATTTRPDHAEAGRLLLDALRERDEHSAAIAANAVVVVSQADREEADALAIAKGFEGLARAVVTIPYDPAMRDQWLRFDSLAKPTQRAYLRAAAAVAAGLGGARP